MIETPAANHRRGNWPWRLALRGWVVLISITVVGLYFGILERDWYWGALAAISLCIILGLAAQVHDLWRGSNGNGAWTSEQRWGWRFAVAWRLVVICLMGVHFLVRVLVKWDILSLTLGGDVIGVELYQMHDAVLLTAMIVAIGSAPRLAKRAEQRWWSLAAELLAGIAACVLWAIILKIQFTIPVLVHITIAGIELAQPLKFASEALAAYDTARLARFFDITTLGVVSVLVSCALLRLLAFGWWRSARWRVCLGVLLAASLTTTIVLSERIALVEVPDITPALAAEIPMPKPHQMVAAVALTLLLVSAAARRGSEPPRAASAGGGGTWRRGEERYYHERRILLLPLAVVMLASLVHASTACWDMFSRWLTGWELVKECVIGLIVCPQLCLSVALIYLAVRSVLSGRSKCPDSVDVDQPQLAPGLFLLIWLVLLAIIVCGVPILGAWGFALWFKLV